VRLRAWPGRRGWWRLAPVLAALCAAGSAWSLDLAQAWEAALARDPQLRAARASTEGSRERIAQARGQLLPQVSASAQRSRNELHSDTPGLGGAPVSQHDFYTSRNETLTLRQPLFRPVLTAQLRQARAVVANAEAVLEQEEQRLLMRLAQSYLETLQAEEQLRLVQVQKAAVTGQLEAARKGFAAGSGTRTDIDEAQARLDLNTAQELEARQNVEFTQRQLALMVGQPVTGVAPVAVERLPLSAPQPAQLEDWLARAEQASPELRAVVAQAEAAREEVQKARAGHYPTLDALAQHSRSDSENPTRIDSRYRQKQIGLQLNVPIYQGGQVQSQVRQALAEVERLEAVLEGTRLDLSSRVHREFRGVTEGIARIRALEQAVRSAEQLALSSRRSQQAGSRTVLDILNAEQQLGTARRDLAQARLAYVLANVRLRTLAGDARDAIIADVNRWLAP
jgi:protease secretion system outer membrane protein